MSIKEFSYRGKKLEEIKKLSVKEFAELVPSRQKRSLIRGLSEEKQKFLEKLKKSSKPVKTHLRDMIILPEMVDKRIQVHSGKEFVSIQVTDEMLGHYLGEFVLTRKRVQHSAPGIGATKSSSAISVR